MTLQEAQNILKNKNITPWMAWGIIKWNNEFAIVDTQFIKRFPNKDYTQIRKGQEFPKEPIFKTRTTY
jgi:hypothetical protein